MKNEKGEENVYFNDISPTYPSSATLPYIVDTNDRYISYDADTIFIHSKKDSDNLTSGSYRYKARAIDKAGNTTDTPEKVLLINTYSANFSHEYFPLLVKGMEGKDMDLLNFNYDPLSLALKLNTIKPITIYSKKPTIWGIAPSNSTVTLTIEKPLIDTLTKTTLYDFLASYSTTTNPASNWGINITNALTAGTYRMTIEATNQAGDYTRLPEVEVKVR